MASLNMVKLKAVVHYTIRQIPVFELGKTKLHKILWFSDREAFLKLGHTITGDTYIRKPRGPMSTSLQSAISELVQEDKIKVSFGSKGQYEKYDYHCLKEPEELPLTQDEKSILDAQIDRIRPMSAGEISEASHDYTWDAYQDGEEIDMTSVLAKPGEVTPEMLQWAMS